MVLLRRSSLESLQELSLQSLLVWLRQLSLALQDLQAFFLSSWLQSCPALQRLSLMELLDLQVSCLASWIQLYLELRQSLTGLQDHQALFLV
jgi:hypothetical protein